MNFFGVNLELAPAISSEDQAMRADIKKAFDEWQAAQNYFQNVADPDLVDFAIYDLEAAKRRYMYMLKKMRPYDERTRG
jgi:hypothetical protein